MFNFVAVDGISVFHLCIFGDIRRFHLHSAIANIGDKTNAPVASIVAVFDWIIDFERSFFQWTTARRRLGSGRGRERSRRNVLVLLVVVLVVVVLVLMLMLVVVMVMMQ